MKSREFDPRRLDIQAFAKDGARLAGEWPLAELARVAEAAHPEAPVRAQDRVQWHVHGEWRKVRGEEAQTWLHMKASAHISLICQRCLQPVPLEIDAHRSFRFVHGEDQAAALDAESEDDVLALVRSLDLAPLVEDELLLSLPLVPMHSDCPLPLPSTVQELHADAEEAHPFAALAALKGRKPQ
jgi:uncharacterized protein